MRARLEGERFDFAVSDEMISFGALRRRERPGRGVVLGGGWEGRRAGMRDVCPLSRPSCGLSISDIVKRKRIRSRAGWGELAVEPGREVLAGEVSLQDPSLRAPVVDPGLTAGISGCV